MAFPTFRLLACCVLLSSAVWAQQPAPPGAAPGRLAATRYVPAPPSPAAQAALRLHAQGCQAEGFDDATCEKAVRQLEAVVRGDPRQLDAQLALADAVWNQAFRQPEGSAERTRLRQRSLDLYQQLVNLGVPDARPYYGLSVLTRDPEARISLLRRTLELRPEAPRGPQGPRRAAAHPGPDGRGGARVPHAPLGPPLRGPRGCPRGHPVRRPARRGRARA
ncbi:hypothetical protein ACN28I_35280 [Archangium gephyra]|uniref:hypothetical protein n=1 Tax=Archangium gephyra TaxID=48 RepID=UPI003B7DD88C